MTSPERDKRFTAQMALALRHHRAGRWSQAEVLYCQILTAHPHHADALHRLGVLAHQLGKLDAAAQLLHHALAVRPDRSDVYCDLGKMLHTQDRADQAVVCYRWALILAPHLVEGHRCLGEAYLRLGRLEDALACYQQALVLDPRHTEAYGHLGNTYANQGHAEAAIRCYRCAIALQPRYADTHNLALTLRKQGQWEKATAYYQLALALRPHDAEAYYHLGYTLSLQHKLDEARIHYQRALTLRPDYVEARYSLGYVFANQGAPRQAFDCYQTALAAHPDLAFLHSDQVYAQHYLPDSSPAERYRAHLRYGEQFEAPLKPQWPLHSNDRSPDRRLKVGYVSPDFRLHSVAFFIEPLLAHHDKTQVEIYTYYNYSQNDAVTDRLKMYVDHWIPCHALSEDTLAQRIQADQIDLLVDLAGHTGYNRLLSFARKPAPVQLSYLGYPSTTGLSAIDYRLSTLDVDPLGQEAEHSESLFRLPHTLWCFRPPKNAPEVSFQTPAQTHGVVTFASLNNLAKVSDPALTLWAQLLLALPNARLVVTNLRSETARTALLERFAHYGLPPERLALYGKLPLSDFHARLASVDLVLDPFPYNGTTTTCEALWMGLPVVSLCGHTSVSRSGYALLKTLGLNELIAFSPEQYLHIALSLARDLPRLSALRQSVRPRFLASPLRQEADFARAVERAYRAMWHTWCRTP